jgi:malate dehydrogenase
MVPLIRYATVGGIPVAKLLDSAQLDAILDRTRHGGDEIVSLLKTGSAYYAPGAAITAMIESILRDKKRVMPTVAYLSGEYGQHDVYAGVPAILGSHGVERIIEIELNEVEKAVFSTATSVTREENTYSTQSASSKHNGLC